MASAATCMLVLYRLEVAAFRQLSDIVKVTRGDGLTNRVVVLRTGERMRLFVVVREGYYLVSSGFTLKTSPLPLDHKAPLAAP